MDRHVMDLCGIMNAVYCCCSCCSRKMCKMKGLSLRHIILLLSLLGLLRCACKFDSQQAATQYDNMAAIFYYEITSNHVFIATDNECDAQ